MRPIYPYDLQDAARVLMAVVPEQRDQTARAILDRAALADRYRKRHRRAHPQFGGGTVGAAARSFQRAPLPWRCDESYLQCMRAFLAVYLDQGIDRET